MLRRLHPDQPESFAFTEANRRWAEAQVTKFPAGREASAIIPLLWRAQEQEGWLTRPAIEHVAGMLGLPYIRALEVATFYFMFHLEPVGSVAHVQVCGTTSCMICGAEDLIRVCKEKIHKRAHEVSEDGKFSWEEVECLGACSNAPMAQIGKDYFEDLTEESFADLLDRMAAGETPAPGSATGRFASEPADGLTSLAVDERAYEANAAVALAAKYGDTLKRIDGTEQPLLTPWTNAPKAPAPEAEAEAKANQDLGPSPEEIGQGGKGRPDEGDVAPEAKRDASLTGAEPDTVDPTDGEARQPQTPGPSDNVWNSALEETDEVASSQRKAGVAGTKPELLDAPKDGGGDDLTRIDGIDAALAGRLNDLGVYHFSQIAAWGEAEIDWVDRHLEGHRGAIAREDWVSQAAELA